MTAPDNLYKPEIEQALLGCFLFDQATLERLTVALEPHHFGDAIYGELYQAMRVIVASGGTLDPQTLGVRLREAKWQGSTADMAGLVRVSCLPSKANDYARMVLELAQRRRGIFEARRALEDFEKDPEDVSALALSFAERFEAIAEGGAGARHVDWGVGTIIEDLRTGEVPPRLMTGFDDFDKRVRSLTPGALVIAAGRAGMGKTTFAVWLARAVAERGAGVCFYSFEMAPVQLQARMLSELTCGDMTHEAVSYQAIEARELDGPRRQAVAAAEARARGLPIRWVDASGMTVADLAADVAQSRGEFRKRGRKLDMIIVDYLGLITPSDDYRGNRVAEVGQISRSLKVLARRTGAVVVALSQLNREAAANARNGGRPRIENLRDSGAIEQDADAVILLHREATVLLDKARDAEGDEQEALMLAAEQKRNDLEIIVGKQRQGETGVIQAWVGVEFSAIRPPVWKGWAKAI